MTASIAEVGSGIAVNSRLVGLSAKTPLTSGGPENVKSLSLNPDELGKVISVNVPRLNPALLVEKAKLKTPAVPFVSTPLRFSRSEVAGEVPSWKASVPPPFQVNEAAVRTPICGAGAVPT